MCKKVLVLSSSPRKGGNSDTLCDQFIKGAQESGKRRGEKYTYGTKESIIVPAVELATCRNPARKRTMPPK